MRIEFARRAVAQLDKIHEYIARDKPDAAGLAIERLVRLSGRLLEQPKLGHTGRRKGTRELMLNPFIIVYRLKGETIQILAVLHGNQKYE